MNLKEQLNQKIAQKAKIEERLSNLEEQKKGILKKISECKAEVKKLESEIEQIKQQDFLAKYYGKDLPEITPDEQQLLDNYRKVADQLKANTQEFLQRHATNS